jgi:serine protease Do
MKAQPLKITASIIVITLLISACSALPALQASVESSTNAVSNTENQTVSTPTVEQPTSNISSLLAAYEGTLENVYAQVNPAVVNIRVVQEQSAASIDLGQFPFDFNLPQNSEPQTPQYSQGLGSGFVWDTQGHIVTNNHVVEGADKIEVTFADGTILPAELVGADSYSDLAVIKVEATADMLNPVQLADSNQVKVGEIAIAIGNPFGLEGTMTVGIVSALGRTLPASSTTTTGAVYSIPDIIQTDAPINPGNSGGVLVDEQGRVMGVTAAIESSVNSNAGIGFAIPAAIVSKVVPALIENGTYEHPYLGVSVSNLTPDLAQAMNLEASQRGALVVTVVDGGPAAEAGLLPSQDTTTIDGQEYPIGGDVITAINDHPITKSDDLIAYLNDETEVGQTASLSLLRDGKEITLDVTLVARPAATAETKTAQTGPEQNLPDTHTSSNAWLGILGANLTTEIAKVMDLDPDQQGVLIIHVESDSPAAEAQLQGSDQEVTINGGTIQIGGDVITAVDGKAVTSLTGLRDMISNHQVGAEITLTILRDGSTIEVPITLAERPANIP